MHKKEGEKLGNALKLAKKSKMWLADATGVHRNTIGNYLKMDILPNDFVQQLGALGIVLQQDEATKAIQEYDLTVSALRGQIAIIGIKPIFRGS